MHLFLLGVSHRTAPVELRERLDFSSRDVGAAVRRWPRARRPREAVRAVDLQPLGDLRRQRRSAAGARRDRRVPGQLPRAAGRGVRAAPLRAVGRRRDAAPVPRGGRPRFAGRRRAADPRPGEGRVPGGRRPAMRRPAADAPVPLVVRRRQARANRDGARRRRGVDGLCRGRAGAQDLRPAGRPERAGGRRRRDQHADRAAPAHAGRRRDRRSPAAPAAQRRGAGGQGRRPRDRLGASWPRRVAGGRHRGDRHRRAAADPHARRRRGGGRRPPLASRSSSSTSPCRATSKPSVGDIEQVFLYNVDDLQALVHENVSRRGRGDRPRRVHRRRGGDAVRGVAAVAGRRADGGGAAAAVRSHPASRARSGSACKLSALSAGRSRARGRGDAAHRREAAARAHRAAEGAARRGDAGRLHRGGEPAVRPARRVAATSAADASTPSRRIGRRS